MKKNFKILLIGILVFSMLGVMACSIFSFKSQAKGAIETGSRQVREHWATTVKLENQMEGQYRVIMTDTSTKFSSIKLNYSLVDVCFTNSEQVINSALESRYSTNTGDRPDGSFDGEAFINAFAVNENYPGDIQVCQEMLVSLSEEISIWNADKADNFAVFWDMVREYDNHVNADIVRSMAVDFAQLVKEKAQEAGLDWVAGYIYPTFNLTVETRDREICDYYSSFGECSWNPALNVGTLMGQGAYDYMTRLFVAPEVSDAFDAGQDTLNPLGE